MEVSQSAAGLEIVEADVVDLETVVDAAEVRPVVVVVPAEVDVAVRGAEPMLSSSRTGTLVSSSPRARRVCW